MGESGAADRGIECTGVPDVIPRGFGDIGCIVVLIGREFAAGDRSIDHTVVVVVVGRGFGPVKRGMGKTVVFVVFVVLVFVVPVVLVGCVFGAEDTGYIGWDNTVGELERGLHNQAGCSNQGLRERSCSWLHSCRCPRGSTCMVGTTL